MINSIIEGISISLNAEFGDNYTTYTESVEQGLKEPCFFVFCINPTNRVFLGKRYFKTNQMCIQYFPVDKDRKKEECNAVSERLFDCLEYITVSGDLVRGTKMNAEIVDGVLNFFVNYDFYVYKKEDASYQGMVERVIVPYFRKRNIKLVDLKATDLQDFYNKQLERVKANSVIHYHANIHKALKYAVKIDLIPTNPADKVERPKKNEFKGSYYSADEIHALTEIAEGTKLEIPVLLASFYGLRRSEVLGLKWDAIDFEANTLEIKHIVTQASIDGKKVLVQADRAKTKSSLRTLPLVPPIRDRLLMLKGQQDTYRRLCGKSYNREYLGYLCVDEIGNIIRPNYVSEQFPKLLEKNGLRPIRFHDLRHSCASLLLANGVPMKQIQEWLGHSDFSTTANIYAHLDYASKLSSAQAMMEGLGYGNASA